MIVREPLTLAILLLLGALMLFTVLTEVTPAILAERAQHNPAQCAGPPPPEIGPYKCEPQNK